MANNSGRRQTFGSIRKLPSGRWQARYTGPDGQVHNAHTTFDTKGDADTWLATVRADIVRETWRPANGPGKALTFGEYAEAWLVGRTVRGKPTSCRPSARCR